MDELLIRAVSRLSTLRRVLANHRHKLPPKAIALLEREIRLAEVHVRVLTRILAPVTKQPH